MPATAKEEILIHFMGWVFGLQADKGKKNNRVLSRDSYAHDLSMPATAKEEILIHFMGWVFDLQADKGKKITEFFPVAQTAMFTHDPVPKVHLVFTYIFQMFTK